MSQLKEVVEYMQKHGGITQLEALNHIGCGRLASRICDLRDAGYKISSRYVLVQNRRGVYVRVKRYSLMEDEPCQHDS